MSDPVQHIVILFLENRSFHSLFADHPKVQASGTNTPNSFFNVDWNGRQYFSSPFGPELSSEIEDFPHDHVAGTIQGAGGENGGFIKATETYDEFTSIGSTNHFVLCDRWFSSIKAPTWPNRNFAISGLTEKVTMPDDTEYTHYGFVEDKARAFFQRFIQAERLADYKFTSPTVFHRLLEKQVPFKIYFQDVPTTLLHRDCWSGELLSRHHNFDAFYQDCRGSAASFPAVSWLEPSYGGQFQNDGHPPAPIGNAENLIGSVYNALRSNEELWRGSLLIVVTDEHGGLFDPVVPPDAVPPAPDPVYQQPIYLLKPSARVVCGTVYDHTSWLRYVQKKFGLGPMGNRVAQAQDFAHLILSCPRDNCPPPISNLPPLVPVADVAAASEFQREVLGMLTQLAVGAATSSQTLLAWSDAADLVRRLHLSKDSSSSDAAGGAGAGKPGELPPVSEAGGAKSDWCPCC